MSNDDISKPHKVECTVCGTPIDPETDPKVCPVCGSGNRRIEVQDSAVLTAAEEATIDRRLDEGSAFLRDVLARPELTDEIPSGSTLAFRTISLHEFGLPSVRLTAFRPRRSRRWGVRVTGIGEFGVPPLDRPAMRWLYSILPLVENATWDSADEAFAAVERGLQSANDVHLLAG